MSDEYMFETGKQIVYDIFTALGFPIEHNKITPAQITEMLIVSQLTNILIFANKSGITPERFEVILNEVAKGYFKARNSAEQVTNKMDEHNRN